jgi:hypothetical protein
MHRNRRVKVFTGGMITAALLLLALEIAGLYLIGAGR